MIGIKKIKSSTSKNIVMKNNLKKSLFSIWSDWI